MIRALADTPNTLLRLEGAMALIASVGAYAYLDASWWIFALLFFLPDISIAGYFAGPSIGAATYNLFHWYGLPIAITAISMASSAMTLVGIGLIWFAHIAFDRMLGYDAEGFRVTYLSRPAPEAAT